MEGCTENGSPCVVLHFSRFSAFIGFFKDMLAMLIDRVLPINNKSIMHVLKNMKYGLMACFLGVALIGMHYMLLYVPKFEPFKIWVQTCTHVREYLIPMFVCTCVCVWVHHEHDSMQTMRTHNPDKDATAYAQHLHVGGECTIAKMNAPCTQLHKMRSSNRVRVHIDPSMRVYMHAYRYLYTQHRRIRTLARA